MPIKTKPSRKLTLRDLLSRLSYEQACQLLGPDGKKLLRAGVAYDSIDIQRDIVFRGNVFRLTFPAAGRNGKSTVVRITRTPSARGRLQLKCGQCNGSCEHLAAVLSLILDNKYALGLARLPSENVPLERLSEAELVERALAERAERARIERFRLKSADPSIPWTDYTVLSAASGKTYRVALRGAERGESYCSCPDFRTNTLGTCKHILYVLQRVNSRFPSAVREQPYCRRDFSVHLHYAAEVTLRLAPPSRIPAEAQPIASRLCQEPVRDPGVLLDAIERLQQAGLPVTIYPDAEEFLQEHLFQQRMEQLVREIRRDPAGHPLRKNLLRVELLAYQLDGIAFAAGAGRAILADDMGLGKTIQAVGVAELLARQADIRRVLVICPASLKSQWRNEIHRFSDRDCQLVTGSATERAKQYDNNSFFTICNYEQVMRDVLAVQEVRWDLIILDEGQRIKNWEAKTSHTIKALKSPFALVLSGTPLENRLDDLYSVVQFIDDRRLAPAFRFFHRHRVVDERGKVIGYKNLDQLRENLQPILLRRTRKSVLQQLPPRSTEVVRIPPTAEQKSVHDAHMRIVTMIANKKFLTEMDLLRLQQELLIARMSANSTFLVDKTPPGFSSKLERLAELVEQLFSEEDRKAVIFSEWTTMLDLIEPLLSKYGVDHVRLDGSVPQKKRQELVNRFQNQADCRAFMASNAGATGLNLQAANTVINIDLPWNPAVLEQRIGRAHRMGQRQPVQVYLLVTEETIEENMLATLSNKHELAQAALDFGSDVTKIDCTSGLQEIKSRLEVLLGARPEASRNQRELERFSRETDELQLRRERVAAAGGQMLGAAVQLLGELVGSSAQTEPKPQVVSQLRDSLAQCVQEDSSGRQQLTITLPDRDALDQIAKALACLLVPPHSNGHG